MSTRFFGPRWDAPCVDHAVQVSTPVGRSCLHCGEPIEEGDRGLLTPASLCTGWVIAAVHIECDLRAVMSHAARQCHCYVAHPGIRAEARATLAALNELRQAQGLEPM